MNKTAFNWGALTDSYSSQLNLIKQLIEKNCPIWKLKDHAIITEIFKAISFSKTNNIPLITFVIDSCHRYHIKYKFYENQPTVDQMKMIEQFQYLYKNNQTIKKFIKGIKLQYNKRLRAQPIDDDPQSLIDDDINKFTNFILSLNQYFQQKSVNKFATFWLDKCYPIQFDVMIIPEAVKYDDNSTNTTEDELKQIADIGDKLKSRNIKYYEADIEEKDYEWTTKKIHDHFNMFMNGKKGNIFTNIKAIDSFDRYKRYIIIYDRRKTKIWNGKQFHDRIKNKLYIFKASVAHETFPTCQLNKTHFKYLYQAQSWAYSHACLIPSNKNWKSNSKIKGKSKDIGIFDPLFGFMFCMSYHLIHQNCVRTYWCSHGSAMRIYQHDYKKIWPKYFVDTKNSINDVTLQILKELKDFTDNQYDIFCKSFGIQNKFIDKDNTDDNKINIHADYSPYVAISNILDNDANGNVPIPVPVPNPVPDPVPVKQLPLKIALRNALAQAYPQEQVAVTFDAVIQEEEYDTDDLADDIIDGADDHQSAVIHAIIEQNINLLGDHFQGLLNVLLPIAKLHQHNNKN